MDFPYLLPRSLRVLVVDDCQDHVHLLSKLLRFWGYRPLAAHDGATALQIALCQRPDAAVLDLRLRGGLDGCEVARRLRGRPDTEDVLLVALTGCEREDERQSCLLAGFDHFLLKPADPEELREVLTSYARGLAVPQRCKSPAVALRRRPISEEVPGGIIPISLPRIGPS